MNINENDKTLFSNVVKKHSLRKEGLLSMLFRRKLKKSLSNDKSISQAIKDGDKALDDLKKATAIMKKKGLKPDPVVAQVLKRYGIS